MNRNTQSVRARTWLVVLILAPLLSGCASSIPDIKPFRDGTVTLRNASSASFNETISAASDIRTQLDEPTIPQSAAAAEKQREAYDQAIDYLVKLRNTRMAVLDGMVNYANALNGIAVQGQASIDRANAVSAATQKMIEGVSSAVAIPSAGASGLLKEGVALFADAATRAYSAYQVAKTNKDLLGRIEANQAAVEALVSALESDLEKLSGVLSTLASSADALREFDRSAIALASARAQLIGKRISRDNITDADLRGATDLELQIATLEAALAPMEQGRAEVARKFELAQGVIASAQEGLKAWRAAHDKLKQTVQDNNTLDATELQSAIEQLQADLKRFRDFADKVAESRKKKSATTNP